MGSSPHACVPTLWPARAGQLCVSQALAFFAQYVNSKTAEAKVLQLDHVQYESIIASYPEQHDIILTNLLETYGLDKSGKTLPSWTSDEDGDGIESKVREIILAAVTKQRQDMESQLLYAVTNADLEKIKTLIRKGVDIETSTYDKSR